MKAMWLVAVAFNLAFVLTGCAWIPTSGMAELLFVSSRVGRLLIGHLQTFAFLAIGVNNAPVRRSADS